MDLINRLINTPCAEGEVLIMWIGQAGFIIKNPCGRILAIDVYLSDLSMRLDGNKRIMPAVVKAEEMKTDLILVTHSHTDHLDLDSLPVMLDEDTNLYCSTESYRMCAEHRLPMEKVHSVKIGDKFSVAGYDFEAVFADHGDTSPDAVGFLIKAGGVTIYFTGDTSYQCDRMKSVTDQKIDVLIVPINGEYGNTNENDAAMLSAQANAGLTIPCHFWTFVRHEGSPWRFETAMKLIAPERAAYVMAPGEIIRYDMEGNWEPI